MELITGTVKYTATSEVPSISLHLQAADTSLLRSRGQRKKRLEKLIDGYIAINRYIVCKKLIS